MSRHLSIRADILCDARFDNDIKAAVSRHIKRLATFIGRPVVCAFDFNLAGAIGDRHVFRSFSAEVVFAGIDQPHGLARAIFKVDGKADHLAIVIHIGFGIDGDVVELLRHWFLLSVVGE